MCTVDPLNLGGWFPWWDRFAMFDCMFLLLLTCVLLCSCPVLVSFLRCLSRFVLFSFVFALTLLFFVAVSFHVLSKFLFIFYVPIQIVFDTDSLKNKLNWTVNFHSRTDLLVFIILKYSFNVLFLFLQPKSVGAFPVWFGLGFLFGGGQK